MSNSKTNGNTDVAVEKKRYLLPNVADLIFILILYLVLYLRQNMLFSDGSTAWHLVSGNYILQHGHVPQTDIMSFTFPNKPWVAYEWLSDLFMAFIVKIGGFNLLAVVWGSAIAFLFLLLFQRCREKGCNFAWATFITAIGSLVSAIHWLARPHLFTFFGVYIFITQLDRYYHGLLSKKKLWLYLTLYMLIWTNCHPGFLIGFALIGIYLFSSVLQYIFVSADTNDKTKKKDQILFLFLTLVSSIVASFCNPYGYRLYQYIFHYLFAGNNIISVTDEFLSPVFHWALQPTLLELLFAIFIVGLLISKTKISLPDLLIYLFFAHMSLAAQRNMALFVIATLPVIAQVFANTIFNPQNGPLFEKLKQPWRTLITKFDNLNTRFSANEQLCTYHILPLITFIVLVIIACNQGKVFGIELMNGGFDPENKPDKTLTEIENRHLDPKHGFSMDNWGGILRYKLNYPVFIDDRADFYGEAFFLEYGIMTQLLPGWQKIIDKYQINWILLPKNNRLIEELKTDKHWQMACEDKASVLMIRK